jgi:hypothetical protein
LKRKVKDAEGKTNEGLTRPYVPPMEIFQGISFGLSARSRPYAPRSFFAEHLRDSISKA